MNFGDVLEGMQTTEPSVPESFNECELNSVSKMNQITLLLQRDWIFQSFVSSGSNCRLALRSAGLPCRCYWTLPYRIAPRRLARAGRSSPGGGGASRPRRPSRSNSIQPRSCRSRATGGRGSQADLFLFHQRNPMEERHARKGSCSRASDAYLSGAGGSGGGVILRRSFIG